MPPRFPHVVVLLPGITGSRLKRGDRIVWGFSPGLLGRTLLTGGDALVRDLALDDSASEDGVVADALIQDLHLIPGLWKIDGYTRVAVTLREHFELEAGRNYFEFPYDWRRDNRVAARRLATASEDWLRAWRKSSGNAEARLVLIGHSMGGLVARYFLECLEGWKSTRALITFGTPYRGSLNAVDGLANGIKGPLGLLDLTRAARSFPALYQLLPIYECYDPGDGHFHRVAETDEIPNLDATRAAAALAFHREIEEAQKKNEQEQAYVRGGYQIFPIVGFEQQTLQSAKRAGSGVKLFAIDPKSGDDLSGDGTVPRVSATPNEESQSGREMFAATKHGSLQNADAVLTQVKGALETLTLDLGDYRRIEPAARVLPRRPEPGPIRLGLEVGDLFTATQTIAVRVKPTAPCEGVRVLVRDASGGAIRDLELARGAGGAFEAELEPLPEGGYELRVEGRNAGEVVEPAADSFAVANA